MHMLFAWSVIKRIYSGWTVRGGILATVSHKHNLNGSRYRNLSSCSYSI